MDDRKRRKPQAGTHQDGPQAEHRGGDGGHHDETGGHGGMTSRGVTRPMMQETEQHEQQGHGDGDDEKMPDHQAHRQRRMGQGDSAKWEEHGGAGQGHEGHGEPYSDMRYQMLRMHHEQTLWIYWTVILFGVWMVSAPFTLGYLNEAQWVEPSGGRGVWFSDQLYTELRAWLMVWSDVLSGLLLIVFGWRSLTPNRPVSLWICCFAGIWLSLAPLVFWAPTAAAYLNDTIVGILVISLTILIPGMPNMVVFMKMGQPRPPGWSYNPSSWPQRWIMIALSFAGFIVSRYLAVYQLGYSQSAWDPFFGGSTERVLNSQMSHAWPISDGGLGALAYTFEFLMGWMGSPARWRTMPWMVAFFGILVIPLGLVHIFLVISQPVMVGYWCTFCLLAAAIMLPMIPIEVDEVIAMGQHMVRAKRRGENLWQVFWKGGSPEGGQSDERSPQLAKLPEKPGAVVKASLWGMSVPWTLALSTALGVWLMASPGALGIEKPASTVFHLGGSLIVVAAVISMGEPLRMGRYLNVLLGFAVAALPWFLDGGSLAGQVNGLVCGLAVTALAIPRGPKTERYGEWDEYVR